MEKINDIDKIQDREIEVVSLDEMMFRYVTYALFMNGGAREKTAIELGISIRTIRNYVNEWSRKKGIHYPVTRFQGDFKKEFFRLNKFNIELEPIFENQIAQVTEFLISDFGFPVEFFKEKELPCSLKSSMTENSLSNESQN